MEHQNEELPVHDPSPSPLLPPPPSRPPPPHNPPPPLPPPQASSHLEASDHPTHHHHHHHHHHCHYHYHPSTLNDLPPLQLDPPAYVFQFVTSPLRHIRDVRSCGRDGDQGGGAGVSRRQNTRARSLPPCFHSLHSSSSSSSDRSEAAPYSSLPLQSCPGDLACSWLRQILHQIRRASIGDGGGGGCGGESCVGCHDMCGASAVVGNEKTEVEFRKTCSDEEAERRPGETSSRNLDAGEFRERESRETEERFQEMAETERCGESSIKPLKGFKELFDEEQSSSGFDSNLRTENRNMMYGDEEKQTQSDEEQQKTSTQADEENQRPNINNDELRRRSSADSEDGDYFSPSDDDDDGDGSSSYRESLFHPRLEGWQSLPAILLEDIFALLTPKQRHQASMVCRPWYEVFYSPRVWHTFVLRERTLTKRRFNLYKGYQRELCPRKTQLCLMRVGRFIRHIIVTAISDYYNLYEFLRVLSSFLTFYPTFPMPLLSSFRFTFACESRGVNGTVIIGTGGNILSKLKDLVSNMQCLHHLTLNQLLLEMEEVEGLLAAAASSSAETLLSLELLNCSKVPMAMCEVTQFSQLRTLRVSPQHLSEEMILLLGGLPQLYHLHLVQDAYTCHCDPVCPQAWKLFHDMAPDKRVFLEIQGRTKAPLLIQPHAPVRGVVFRTPYHQLTPELTSWLTEHYAKTLEYFVQECLPRHHGSRKFPDRADERLLRLVQSCPRLHTVVIRERLSLATMLLLAREGRTLRSLTLRRNALLKKCEWPRSQAWTEDFYRWLKAHGKDYDLAFSQMPLLMKRPWKPAVDKAFKYLKVHVT